MIERTSRRATWRPGGTRTSDGLDIARLAPPVSAFWLRLRAPPSLCGTWSPPRSSGGGIGGSSDLRSETRSSSAQTGEAALSNGVSTALPSMPHQQQGLTGAAPSGHIRNSSRGRRAPECSHVLEPSPRSADVGLEVSVRALGGRSYRQRNACRRTSRAWLCKKESLSQPALLARSQWEPALRSGSLIRSQRRGQGFKSPHLHRKRSLLEAFSSPEQSKQGDSFHHGHGMAMSPLAFDCSYRL